MSEVALVVGGSGGIGGALARHLAADVQRVAITYRSNAEAAAAIAATAPDRITTHRLDLETGEGLDALAPDGLSRVFYCAGPRFRMDYLGRTSASELAAALHIEAAGFARVLEATLPRLRDNRGALVAISSAALGRHVPKDTLSTAPKAAIEAMVRAVAREEGRFGVRANAVRVGVVDGGMFHHFANAGGGIDDAWMRAATANVPLGRLGTLDEVARVAAFLGSPDASYVSGQFISVDGGFSV